MTKENKQYHKEATAKHYHNNKNNGYKNARFQDTPEIIDKLRCIYKALKSTK